MPTIIIFYMLIFYANVFTEKYEYELYEGKNFNILPGLQDLYYKISTGQKEKHLSNLPDQSQIFPHNFLMILNSFD